MSRFDTVSTGWKPNSSRTPDVAEPSNLAVADSFLSPCIGGAIAKMKKEKNLREKRVFFISKGGN
jgi:hypothetical protein